MSKPSLQQLEQVARGGASVLLEVGPSLPDQQVIAIGAKPETGLSQVPLARAITAGFGAAIGAEGSILDLDRRLPGA